MQYINRGDWWLTDVGLPGYMLPYLVGYLFVFTYSKRILEIIAKCPISISLAQFLVINIIVIWAFHNGLYEESPFISYLIGMISASSVFCTLYVTFQKSSSNKIVVWLSGISFEIYLVHEFFLGRYSVYQVFDFPLWGMIALLSLSAISALGIRNVSIFSYMCYQTIINKIIDFRGYSCNEKI